MFLLFHGDYLLYYSYRNFKHSMLSSFPNCFTIISLDINLFRVLSPSSLFNINGFPHVDLIHFSHLIFPRSVLSCMRFVSHLEPRPTVCADQAPHLGIISSGLFYFFLSLLRGILGPFVNRVRP